MTISKLKEFPGDPLFYLALVAGPLFLLTIYSTDTMTVRMLEISNISINYVLLIVLIYPILEEIVFRKGIQGIFYQTKLGAKEWGGISLANLMASIVFSASHLIYQTPKLAAAVFFPSLIFGFFRDKYENILPGTIIHICYNGTYALYFYEVCIKRCEV